MKRMATLAAFVAAFSFFGGVTVETGVVEARAAARQPGQRIHSALGEIFRRQSSDDGVELEGVRLPQGSEHGECKQIALCH